MTGTSGSKSSPKKKRKTPISISHLFGRPAPSRRSVSGDPDGPRRADRAEKSTSRPVDARQAAGTSKVDRSGNPQRFTHLLSGAHERSSTAPTIETVTSSDRETAHTVARRMLASAGLKPIAGAAQFAVEEQPGPTYATADDAAWACLSAAGVIPSTSTKVAVVTPIAAEGRREPTYASADDAARAMLSAAGVTLLPRK